MVAKLIVESKKDPGIPSQWPYKQAVLDDVEKAKNQKQNEIQVKQQKKYGSPKSDHQNWIKEDDKKKDTHVTDLTKLMANINQKQQDYDFTNLNDSIKNEDSINITQQITTNVKGSNF